MPTYKVSFDFNTLVGPGAGWSEVFYVTSDLSLGDLVAALTNCEIAVQRTNLLHPNYYFFAIRANDVAVKRRARVNFFTTSEGKGQYPADPVSGTSEAPFVAVNVYMSNNQTTHRSYHLHGLPINVVTDTYAYNGDVVPAWATRFTNWNLAMRGLPVPGSSKQIFTAQMFKLNFSTPNVILSVLPAAYSPKAITFTTLSLVPIPQTDPPTPAIGPGSYVKVDLVDRTANVNRVWRVKSVDPLAGVPQSWLVTTFPHRQFPIGLPTPLGGIGQYQSRNPAATAIQFIDPVEGVERKVGRPFELPSGRRRLQFT